MAVYHSFVYLKPQPFQVVADVVSLLVFTARMEVVLG